VDVPDRDVRDEWMRRLGPLYPALVALGSLTRVPLPRGLEPTRDDLGNSTLWLPIVGALIGAVIAGVIELFLALGLVPAIAGALGLLAGLALTGGMLELGLARAVELAPRASSRTTGEPRLAGVLALGALLALRALGLLGMALDVWLAALVVAVMVARWCPLLAHVGALGIQMPAPEHARATLVSGPGTPVRMFIAGAITVAIALWLARGVGLLAVVIGVVAYAASLWLAQRSGRGVTAHGLAAAAATTELIVLLVFAAAHPAMISAWVAVAP
jgi:adenosylcobinamide-GDP ribazoletransferase